MFGFGSASVEVFAPRSDDYGNLNNGSVVMKITYGKVSYLLCADAEEKSEKKCLSPSG
jgi:beta-lactamase superfamily II metal-dependent hydrolase